MTPPGPQDETTQDETTQDETAQDETAQDETRADANPGDESPSDATAPDATAPGVTPSAPSRPVPGPRVAHVTVTRPSAGDAADEPVPGDGPRVRGVDVRTPAPPAPRAFVRPVPLPRNQRPAAEPAATVPPVTVTPVRLPLPVPAPATESPNRRTEEPQP